jgi:hypothetical protein
MRIDSVGNVGIGLTPFSGGKLDIRGSLASGNQVFIGDSQAIAANIGGGISFGGYYTGTSSTSWAQIQGLKDNATDGNYAGYMSFLTRANGSASVERMRIDSTGSSLFRTKKVGMGTQTGNSKEVQTISWSGTVTNGTTDLLTNTTFGENGHAGMFLLNMMTAGKGVSRIYFLTGRYAQCTLTMYQGGNRSAGEDAYLQLTGGSNTIGLQLVTSGWAGATYYYVVGFLGISTVAYDNWFSN